MQVIIKIEAGMSGVKQFVLHLASFVGNINRNK
jgi:hypothetical protein